MSSTLRNWSNLSALENKVDGNIHFDIRHWGHFYALKTTRSLAAFTGVSTFWCLDFFVSPRVSQIYHRGVGVCMIKGDCIEDSCLGKLQHWLCSAPYPSTLSLFRMLHLQSVAWVAPSVNQVSIQAKGLLCSPVSWVIPISHFIASPNCAHFITFIPYRFFGFFFLFSFYSLFILLDFFPLDFSSVKHELFDIRLSSLKSTW